MKFKTLVLFFFTVVISLHPQSFRNVHGNYTIDDIQKNISFDIFVERSLYEEGEILPIYFRIKNNGYESFRFYLDQKYGSSFF